MSKIEIKLNNIDEQKKILNNGKLNMIDVVQHLKINNIVNYHYTDKIFLFMLNESVISIKLLKFITTKKIIKFINMNIQNNECNILYNYSILVLLICCNLSSKYFYCLIKFGKFILLAILIISSSVKSKYKLLLSIFVFIFVFTLLSILI